MSETLEPGDGERMEVLGEFLMRKEQWEKEVAQKHLIPAVTDRGFKSLMPIPSAYGGDVRVYESSAAISPHIWLSATAPVELSESNDLSVRVPMHLTIESARQLAEQLLYLVENHYQVVSDRDDG